MTMLFEKAFRAIFPHENPEAIKREYKMPESINFLLRPTKNGWFVVTMPDHPGLITEANTHQGLLEMVNDALLTYYDVPKRKADIIYDRLNISDTVVQFQGQLQTKSA